MPKRTNVCLLCICPALHASVHGADGAERQMLFEALSCLGSDDVLILDRGYPAAWLVAYLTEHNIRFCMRCEKSSGGWAAVRAFERSDQVDAMVTLNKPNRWDCEDYGYSGAAPQVTPRSMSGMQPSKPCRLCESHPIRIDGNIRAHGIIAPSWHEWPPWR